MNVKSVSNDVSDKSWRLVRCRVGRAFSEVDCRLEDHQDDDEVAEVQRAGRDDGGLQPSAPAAAPAAAGQEHLRRALRRP